MKFAKLLLPVLLFSACSEQSAESYLQSAKQQLQQQNNDAAIIELKNAIRTEPKLAEARFLLGQTYLKNHQYPQAEKELERALDLGYSAEKVVQLLSKAYQKTGADNALLDLPFQKVGLTAEQAAEVYFYKLQAFINLDQQQKAKNFINKIKSLNTDSPYKSLALIYNLLLQDNVDAANVALDDVLSHHPQHADALKLKGKLLLGNGEVSKAVDIYRNYVSAYPEDLETSFVFARILTDNGQTQEAEPIIDKLLSINNKNPLLNQLKSLARFNAKDFEQALSFAENALIKSPDDTALRLVAGVSAYYLKDASKANQHLSLIASILPPSHRALRLLAASQLQLGLNLEANNTVSKLDQITEKDSALLSSVGLALVDSGEVSKAQAILDKAPDSADTPEELARLGLLKISLNDVSGILNLEQALESTTNQAQQPPIGKVLATAYLSTEQFDKAIALAEKWKQTPATQIDGFMLAGLSHAKSKNYVLAKKEFEQALTINPDNAQVTMALIELQASTDESFSEADELAALTELIKKHNSFIPALSRAYLLSRKLGDSESIINHVKTTLTNEPSNKALTLTLAKMYYAEQNYSNVISTLAEMPQDKQTPATQWSMLGQSYLQLQQFEKAVSLYQQWLEFAPNNSEAIIGNVVILESQGRFAEALEISQQYVDRQSANQQPLANSMQILHTHLLILNKQFEPARALYNQLSENSKKQPVSAGLLGQIQLHDKDYQAALPNLQLAYQYKQNPRNARLVYMCLKVLEQNKEAFNFLSTHIENNPSDQVNLMELAMAQIALDSNKAIASYQKIIELNDKNIIAHNNVAYLYLQQNQLDLAQKHAEIALSIDGENKDVLDTLGQISLLKNENEKALAYLSKAVKVVNPQEKINEEIFVNYIEALYLNGKVMAANKRLEGFSFSNDKIAQRAAELKAKYNP